MVAVEAKRHCSRTERLDVYMEQSSTGRGGLLRRNRAHSSTPQTTETRIPRHGADHRTGTGHRNHEPLSDNPTVRLLNQLSLPDIMVRVFPEQAAPPTLASPAVGAEEVFVHEGEPARELLLLHAPQAPPLAQLPRTVPPPHRFLLRQRRWKRRGRLLRAGGRNRVIVAFFALRSRRPRPSRRSRPGRRHLLPSRRLGGDLGGRCMEPRRRSNPKHSADMVGGEGTLNGMGRGVSNHNCVASPSSSSFYMTSYVTVMSISFTPKGGDDNTIIEASTTIVTRSREKLVKSHSILHAIAFASVDLSTPRDQMQVNVLPPELDSTLASYDRLSESSTTTSPPH
ncbi:hypothetical protein BHM03_00051619 [Ensete ventricosum]|nr:hypothetical protein BHM03_00051619 [Ensete ventricosum]